MSQIRWDSSRDRLAHLTGSINSSKQQWRGLSKNSSGYGRKPHVVCVMSQHKTYWPDVSLLLGQRRRRGPTLNHHWHNVLCFPGWPCIPRDLDQPCMTTMDRVPDASVQYTYNDIVWARRRINTRRWNNVFTMLGQHHKRWPNIGTTLVQCVCWVAAEYEISDVGWTVAWNV